MKLNQVFKSNYLKAEDLQGRTVQLRVEKADVVDFDDGQKVVLHFVGKDKGLVCNKTNCSVMQEITGSDDTDNWTDCMIMLTVRKVEFQGKLVPALRILLPDQAPAPVRPAPPAPVPVKAAPVQQPDNQGPSPAEDDVPF